MSNEMIDAKRNSAINKIKIDRDKRKKLENIEIANKLINDFILSDSENVQDFCSKYLVSISDFKFCIKLIKENNKELFYEFQNNLDMKLSKMFYKIKPKVDLILYLLDEGVYLGNGEKREFNIIDYYNLINISLDEFSKILDKKYTIDDVRKFAKFKSFYSSFKSWIGASLKSYYDTKVVIGVEFDENKKVIPGTGRELTLEEKKSVIKYIAFLGAPINDKTVSIVQRGLVLGNLNNNFEQNNKSL